MTSQEPSEFDRGHDDGYELGFERGYDRAEEQLLKILGELTHAENALRNARLLLVSFERRGSKSEKSRWPGITAELLEGMVEPGETPP